MRRSRRNGQFLASLFDAAGIAFHDQYFFLIDGGFGKHLTKRIADERMTPEFEAAFGGALVAHSIHGGDKNAIGDGVGALNGAPGVELRRAEFLLFRQGASRSPWGRG